MFSKKLEASSALDSVNCVASGQGEVLHSRIIKALDCSRLSVPHQRFLRLLVSHVVAVRLDKIGAVGLQLEIFGIENLKFIKDQVDHRQGQSAIGSHPDGYPFVSL